ncbi:hypothetical protein TrVE_jg10613 [Triparma verrucosa]|uniref:Uncharacterized protein n=1 Tax=Triparma verrucosa TaxID=1606542 RepID=A0A9W7C4N7_9STRA|nr:hypothetical protein TrVE_jg10613 [Triparma verrucosa]
MSSTQAEPPAAVEMSSKNKATPQALDPLVVEALNSLKAQHVLALNDLKSSLTSTFQKKIEHQSEEIEGLRLELDALHANRSTAVPTTTRISHISEWWRLIFFTFAVIPSIVSVWGYLMMNFHAAYVSLTFWSFAAVCLEICVLTSPQRYKSKREKAKIAALGMLFGLSPLFSGLTLLKSAHNQTKLLSYFIIFYSSCWILVMPLTWLCLTKLYSKMSEAKLSHTLLAIFKSQFGVLCTLLYVATTPLRCIANVPSTSNILDSCGNPIFNTIWVSLAIMIAWHVGYVIHPIIGRRALRWSDIMAFRLNLLECVQFVFFCVLAVSAMVLFASTNPQGSPFDGFMQVTTCIFLFSAGTLLFMLGLEYIMLPFFKRVWRGSEGSVRMTGASSEGENGAMDFKDTSTMSLGVVF